MAKPKPIIVWEEKKMMFFPVLLFKIVFGFEDG